MTKTLAFHFGNWAFLSLFLFISVSYNAQIVPDSVKLGIEDSLSQEGKIPVFNQSEEDGDDGGSQDIAGLLQSSRDVFTATAGFTFGVARYRIRGLDAENTAVLINGIAMNDLESGRASWSGWGGLNDVTRFMVNQTGIAASREMFTGIGGYTSISARASQFKKSTRFSYSASNRNYRNRIMFTHSTGLLKNGWSFSVSASRRWAQEGYIDGTFFDAWSYFGAAEKKFNDKHSLSLSVIGTSQVQGMVGMVVQEAYDLAGSNYYNPLWGYQNGEKRNSRVRNVHKPTAFLTHYFKVNKSLNLRTTLYMSGGRGGTTRLNWYETNNPNPNYYKYLPSYQDPGSDLEAQAINSWQNDVNTRQVRWDDFYNANRINLYTVSNANGIAGNDITGMRSKYIIEEQRNDHIQYGGNINFDKKIGEKVFLSGGYNVHFHNSHNYRQIVDLLGGEFWVDVDQFAEQLFIDPNLAQNNVAIPNHVVKEGDIYGYDYNNHVQNQNLFGQIEQDLGKFSYFVAANLSTSSYWRTGNMQNGRFLDNSFGDSEKINFFNGGGKFGMTYKINGRHYLTANGANFTRAPEMRNLYISPRTRNDVVSNVANEVVRSGDLSYFIRHPFVKMRITGYYSEVLNQTQMRIFYHDEYNSFVNYLMTGVNNLYTGVEFGAEFKLSSTLQATAVFGNGQAIYNSRPLATISVDNTSELVAENRTVYLKNYKVGGTPQTVGSIGLKYSSPKFWFIGVNANYFGNIYLDPNPDRRTAEAVNGIVVTDPQWNEILDQTKLPNGFTIDAYAGKSYRTKKGHFLNINFSASNILNNKKFIVGGFEQLRYLPNNISKFPPQYSYMFGFNFFAQVSYSF